MLENPMASGVEHHHNGLLQMGTSELPEANGVNLGNIYQGEWPMHRGMLNAVNEIPQWKYNLIERMMEIILWYTQKRCKILSINKSILFLNMDE